MEMRIRHAACWFIARALVCGLTVAIAGCASGPSPASKAIPASRVKEVLGYIGSSYVDPVETQPLIDACLRKLPAPAAAGAEVRADTGEHSVQQIESALARLPAPEASAAADSCIAGMIFSLGGRSRFLDVKDFGELTGKGPARGGIGLELASAPEGARIVGAIEGAPAESANIAPGDLLTAINDVDLRGKPLGEIIDLMRGEPGSPVAITLQRAGQSEPLHVTVTRQEIHVKSFEGQWLQAGVIYLRCSQLNDRMPDLIAEQMYRLRRQDNEAFRGIVLDLRNNRGGLLHSAIAVSAAFLPPGTLVAETKGRSADSNQRYLADPQNYIKGRAHDPLADLPELKSAPIVVLIDGQTASGAEVIASALQDHKRAILVGEHSFGLGSIDTIVPIKGAGTAIRITTARIYRPDGDPIDGKGVEPDIVVAKPSPPNDRPPASNPPLVGRTAPIDDPAVIRALEILRSSAAS